MWFPIDEAPKDRKVAVICANGHVDKAWWHDCAATATGCKVHGWINGGRVLDGLSSPILYAELPALVARIQDTDSPHF